MSELIKYLQRESKYQYTEFRLVVNTNGHCLIHVYDRDSETFDFDLPLRTSGGNSVPEDIQKKIMDDIDKFEANKGRPTMSKVTFKDLVDIERINRLNDEGWRCFPCGWFAKNKYGIHKMDLSKFSDEEFEQVINNGRNQ